jgi:hypothetical protein
MANLAGSEMLKGMVADNERHLAMNAVQKMVGARDANNAVD